MRPIKTPKQSLHGPTAPKCPEQALASDLVYGGFGLTPLLLQNVPDYHFGTFGPQTAWLLRHPCLEIRH